jgi:formylglycine-generating enzyme required for sulfatase activity
MRNAWAALLLAAGCAAASPERAGGDQPGGEDRVAIPGTSLSIAMLPVPPGDHPALRMSVAEIPWEAYDAFVFRLDEKDPSLPAGADAVARPSQPYITMDRAFGHAGYPAISVSYLGAQSFCAWLSKRTGRAFRLPTEAEWELAARAGGAASDLAATAWTRENAGAKTHPVGAKGANAWGFHDLLGNAAEWCTASDGSGVLRGGSYRDAAGDVLALRQPADKAWNKSDPQIPKSKWWLADGGFVGFRIVYDPPHGH